jgi:hypothetical protein
MATKKRTPTLAAGAVYHRTLVRRWARRQLQSEPKNATLLKLIAWLDNQAKRTAREGGIGSK